MSAALNASLIWLAPSALWWLLALAVPILVHWLAHKRKRTQAFAAIALIPDSDNQASVWERWRDRLLLLLRLLLITALVLALAAPQWREDVLRSERLKARFALPASADVAVLQLCDDGRLQTESCPEPVQGLWSALQRLATQQPDLATLELQVPAGAIALDVWRPVLPFAVKFEFVGETTAQPESNSFLLTVAGAGSAWQQQIQNWKQSDLRWQFSDTAPLIAFAGNAAQTTDARVVWHAQPATEPPDLHWQERVVREQTLQYATLRTSDARASQLHVRVPDRLPDDMPERWRAVLSLSLQWLAPRPLPALVGQAGDVAVATEAAPGRRETDLQNGLWLLAALLLVLERGVSGGRR